MPNSKSNTTRLTPKAIAQFRKTIYQYYRRNKRTFPWRQTSNPYFILVSEIMLQQTQTSRVISKYEEFITEFPDFCSLATAPLRKILQVWQGLGYNRRAIALQKIAQIVIADFAGEVPSSPEILKQLPGIGPYTASAISALAFNQPIAFIETNIRTVFLHFFFAGQDKVEDRALLDFVEQTLDRSNLRKWYCALFDYGAMLKKKQNLESKSAHYRKQSPFAGSNRELRSKIIRLLLENQSLSQQDLIETLDQSSIHIRKNLKQLQNEGFITVARNKITIA